MSVTMVSLADTRAEPWRNGGGTTRSLLTWPHATDWRVRVSVADIERSGAFSMYPGVERWFCVLEGEGVQLTVNGHARKQGIDDPPLRFDGASAVNAALTGGTTRDLNLMIEGGHGVMRPVEAGVPWHPGAAQFCAVFAWQAGRLIVLEDDGKELHLALPEQSLVWLSHQGRAPQALHAMPASDGMPMRAWWLAATLNKQQP